MKLNLLFNAKNNFLLGTLLLTGGLLITLTGSAFADDAKQEGKVYAEHVQCEGSDCKIDLYLTRGFRAFSQCQPCHGLNGDGTTIAPSLLKKLQEIDRARFDEVVIDGYKGQIGVMPPWKENPNVMKYLDQLYAYLMALSDGAIPAGKLARFDR
jgi:mono/diheme cytochrome c family protein